VPVGAVVTENAFMIMKTGRGVVYPFDGFTADPRQHFGYACYLLGR